MHNPFENLGGLGDLFKGGGGVESVVHNLLSKVDFPIGKQELINKAQELNMPEPVMHLINGLTDKVYGSKDDVVDEAKKMQ